MNNIGGWSNLTTWAINFAINNDLTLYKKKCEFLEKEEVNADTVRHFITTLLPKGVEDCRRIQYNKVNWEETAVNWNTSKTSTLIVPTKL